MTHTTTPEARAASRALMGTILESAEQPESGVHAEILRMVREAFAQIAVLPAEVGHSVDIARTRLDGRALILDILGDPAQGRPDQRIAIDRQKIIVLRGYGRSQLRRRYSMTAKSLVDLLARVPGIVTVADDGVAESLRGRTIADVVIIHDETGDWAEVVLADGARQLFGAPRLEEPVCPLPAPTDTKD